MLLLTNKDFEAVIKYMIKNVKSKIIIIGEQKRNTNRKMGTIKKEPKLNSRTLTTFEMKNSLDGLSSRLDTV